jgi:hypothetical protein
MTNKSDPCPAVFDALKAAGFIEDGHTVTHHVRIGTAKNPVYGGLGGKAATFGGRQRFVRPGTQIKATVGPRTTNFYLVGERVGGRNKIDDLGSTTTSDLDKINEIIAALPT